MPLLSKLHHARRCGICLHAYWLLLSAFVAVAAPAEVTFHLAEELGLARKAEPVVITGAQLLPHLPEGPLPCDRLRLHQGDREIPLQIDERDGGPTWAEAPNGLLDPDDQLVFLADLPANSVGSWRLVMLDEATVPSPAGELVAEQTDRAKAGYDVKLANSRLEIGLRTSGIGRSEGMVGMLRLDGEPFRHVAFPYTQFQQRRDEGWESVRIVAAGPVRAIAVAHKLLKGSYRHNDGEWSITWDDEADIDGDLYRSFTLYAASPTLDVDDTFVAKRSGDIFLMNYNFRLDPPVAEGQDWQRTRRLLIPHTGGYRAMADGHGEQSQIKLDDDARGAGWIGVRDAESGFGMVLAYEPDDLYQVVGALRQPWLERRAFADSLATDLFIGRTAPAVPGDGMGQLRFRLRFLGPGDSSAVDLWRRAQFQYALQHTLQFGELPAGRGSAALDEAEAILTELEPVLTRHPALLTIEARQTLKQLKDRLDISRKIQGKGPAMDRLLVDRARDIMADAKALENGFVARRQALFAGDSGSYGRGFSAFIADSMTKLHPDGPLPETPEREISLRLAGNEYEPFQVALVNGHLRQTELNVTVSDLVSATGATLSAAESVRRFRVGYVPKPESDEPWPDPLIPLAGCPDFAPPAETLFPPEEDALGELPANDVTSLWFTVHAPADTPAGEYRGTITVATARGKLELPITVQVYGFSLPERSSLSGDIWFANGLSFLRYYGRDVTLDEFAPMVEMLRGYRVNTHLSWLTLSPLVKVSIDQDGHYRFDFTELEPWLEVALKENPWFNINLGGGAGWTAHYAGVFGRRTPILDTRTGETIRFPEKPMSNEEILAHPIFTDFWTAYTTLFREKGWMDQCYIENIDEPPYGPSRVDAPRNLFLRDFHDRLRKIAPDLRLFSYGTSPAPRMHPWAAPYLDLWGPSVSSLDEALTELREQQVQGRPFHTYVCGGMRRKMGLHTPDVYIDQPGIDLRIIPWMAWRYGAEGVLYYAGNGWVGDPAVQLVEQNPRLRWPATPWRLHGGAGFGNGWFTYPAPATMDIFPSIRLENIRDGLEDYEYLALLQRLSPEADPEVAELVKSTMVWSKDPAVLRARRHQLALAIEALHEP